MTRRKVFKLLPMAALVAKPDWLTLKQETRFPDVKPLSEAEAKAEARRRYFAKFPEG